MKKRKCLECGKDISDRSLRTIYCSSYCSGKAAKRRFEKKHGNKDKLRHNLIMKRDELIKVKGEKCYFCSSKKGLCLHHINYKDNDPNNILLLCNSCHTKVHNLQRMFQNVLK